MSGDSDPYMLVGLGQVQLNDRLFLEQGFFFALVTQLLMKKGPEIFESCPLTQHTVSDGDGAFPLWSFY